jgi:hypothetical protein
MVHVIGDAAFVGDTLFMPDGGSARADFPGGDAGELYDSIQKVLALPDDMRLFMCHDYGPDGRDIMWETTVAEEKAENIHVGQGKSREEFIIFREARDATLDVPKLILPSLQVNMRAGGVPSSLLRPRSARSIWQHFSTKVSSRSSAIDPTGKVPISPLSKCFHEPRKNWT